MQSILVIRTTGSALYEFTQEVTRFVKQSGVQEGLLTALTAVSLSIPITNARPALGRWQGIYLFEHRDGAHARRVVAHIAS